MKSTALWLRMGLCALLFALPLTMGACGKDDDPATVDELLDAVDADQNVAFGDGKFIEGLRIAGVSVGGMTAQEADVVLTLPFDQLLSQQVVNINVDGEIKTLPAKELGMRVDTQRTYADALALGEDGSDAGKAIVEQAKALGYDAPVHYTVDLPTLNTSLVSLASEINTAATEPTVSLGDGSGDRFNFTPGQDGKTVDTAALAASIQQAVESGVLPITVTAQVTTTPATNSVEDLQKNVSKIVTFGTKYTGSSDRTSNLVLGASKINGYVLMPGKTFSFNDVVGPRDEKNGWKEAATIVGGSRYENDFGGGICQVSTTLYNAVLKADLEIVERNKHSIPSNYIEHGLDATVAYGSKDFKFRNNTDYPVYIFANVNKDESKMYVSIYGRPLPDGETIILRSREIGTTEAEPAEIIEDETMSLGKTAWEIDRRKGITVEVYKEYKRDGAVVREEVMYKDTYSPVRGVQRVGVGSSGSSSSSSSDAVDIPSEGSSERIEDFGAVDLPAEEEAPIDLPSEGTEDGFVEIPTD